MSPHSTPFRRTSPRSAGGELSAFDGSAEVRLAVVRAEERADGEVGVEGEEGTGVPIEARVGAVGLRRFDHPAREWRIAKVLGQSEILRECWFAELATVFEPVRLQSSLRSEPDATQPKVGPIR